MKYRAKKLIAFLMAFLMVAQIAPVPAAAEQLEFPYVVDVTVEGGVDLSLESGALYFTLLQHQTISGETADNLSYLNGQQRWFMGQCEITTSGQFRIDDLLMINGGDYTRPYEPSNTGVETKVFLGVHDGHQYHFQDGNAENGFIDFSEAFTGYEATITNTPNKTTIVIHKKGSEPENEDDTELKNGPVEGANIFVNITGSDCLAEDGYYLYVGDPFAGDYSTAKYSGLGKYGFKYEGTGTLYVVLKEATSDTVTSPDTYDIVKWIGDESTTDPRGIGNYTVSTAKNDNTYTITFEENETGDGTVTINFPSDEDVAKSNGYYLLLTKKNSDTAYVIALGGTQNPITENIKKVWSNGGAGEYEGSWEVDFKLIKPKIDGNG